MKCNIHSKKKKVLHGFNAVVMVLYSTTTI